jgi:hypothetical protein
VVYYKISIGEPYLGGKIAYILQLGDTGYDIAIPHGLIAAAADQSTGIIWAILAYQGTTVGTLITLDSGSANTDKIIEQNGAGSTYAAGLARAYNGGGYTDWYLPSQEELNKLYLNRDAIGGFEPNWYWSSTEREAAPNGQSMVQTFGDNGYGSGYSGWLSKDSSCRVRAIRSF